MTDHHSLFFFFFFRALVCVCVGGQLCGKRIATSFPNITREFFSKLDPEKVTQVRELSGSVEAACGLGLADAVVDLVETGTTMRGNYYFKCWFWCFN